MYFNIKRNKREFLCEGNKKGFICERGFTCNIDEKAIVKTENESVITSKIF